MYSYCYVYVFFFISNFRRVLNLVCILLGISPASDCGLPTFRNPVSVPSSRAGCKVYFILYIQSLKMELIEGSETSANHNRTPGKYPKEYIQVYVFLLIRMFCSVYSVSLCCSVYCFVCKCVMCYCHRVSTHPQSTNISYHTYTYKQKTYVVSTGNFL